MKCVDTVATRLSSLTAKIMAMELMITSFAKNPGMSVAAVCHELNPSGVISGAIAAPIMCKKLWSIGTSIPDGPV